MSRANASTVALPQPLGLAQARFYLATAAMVLGNVALPYAVHRIPDAGRVLLPIFFFTLLAGWRFGAKVGLLTGLVSPLANHFLTGMPPGPMVFGLMWQSALLGVLAALAASRISKPTLAVVAAVVLAHQSLILFPQVLHGGLTAALATAKVRLPGILLQIVGGFGVLWSMAFHLTHAPTTTDRKG